MKRTRHAAGKGKRNTHAASTYLQCHYIKDGNFDAELTHAQTPHSPTDGDRQVRISSTYTAARCGAMSPPPPTMTDPGTQPRGGGSLTRLCALLHALQPRTRRNRSTEPIGRHASHATRQWSTKHYLHAAASIPSVVLETKHTECAVPEPRGGTVELHGTSKCIPHQTPIQG